MSISAEELSLIANSYSEAEKAVMEQYGMTAIEVDVMLFLANNPQFDTAAEIVSVRRIAKSHVSMAVSKLTARGFLKKLRDEKDRKKIHLRITENASPMVRDAQQFQKDFRTSILKGFAEEEKHQMEMFGDRIGRNIRDFIG